MLPILSRQGTTENKDSSPCFSFKNVYILKGKVEQDFLFLIFIDLIWVTVPLSPSKTKSACLPTRCVMNFTGRSGRTASIQSICVLPNNAVHQAGRLAGFLSSVRTKLGCFLLSYVSVQNK
jgi:hypothetical protein